MVAVKDIVTRFNKTNGFILYWFTSDTHYCICMYGWQLSLYFPSDTAEMSRRKAPKSKMQNTCRLVESLL